jgi:hypothetical protein
MRVESGNRRTGCKGVKSCKALEAARPEGPGAPQVQEPSHLSLYSSASSHLGLGLSRDRDCQHRESCSPTLNSMWVEQKDPVS